MKAKWSSSDAVQSRILDAALDTFITRGYSESKLTDIVEAAGVSVGSIYHHFGGKEDLFYACARRFRSQLRKSQGLDPDQHVPESGAWELGYLRAVREHRAVCLVFLGTDTPPGFEPGPKGVEYYADQGEHSARMLSAVLLEAMRIICECSDVEVESILDSTIKLLNVIRAVGF